MFMHMSTGIYLYRGRGGVLLQVWTIWREIWGSEVCVCIAMASIGPGRRTKRKSE